MQNRTKAAGTEDSVLAARIEDTVRLCEVRNCPKFIGFLDEKQSALAVKIANNLHFDTYMLWGGYQDAERVVFGAFPPWQQPDGGSFPVTPLYLTFRKEDKLTHRDFLGTMMAQGVNRDTIGDILVEDGRCVLFVKNEVVDYITAQIQKVGGAGVTFSSAAGELPQGRGLQELSATVASARLDCVVSALIGSSREKGCDSITAGKVTLNYDIVLSVSAKIAPGDKLSIKGYGKYIVNQIGPPTKKGRLKMVASKYR